MDPVRRSKAQLALESPVGRKIGLPVSTTDHQKGHRQTDRGDPKRGQELLSAPHAMQNRQPGSSSSPQAEHGSAWISEPQ